MKIAKKYLVILLVAIFLLSTFSFSIFAADEKVDEGFNEKISSFNNPEGRVMSLAHQGDIRFFPENSLEGIRSCAEMGVDIVQTKVRRTKDGNFILMQDEDLGRTCVYKDGRNVNVKVSDITLPEIKDSFVLKNGKGGPLETATKISVPSLEEALDMAKGKCLLLIDIDFKDAREINNLVRGRKATDYVILRGIRTTEEANSFLSNGLPICGICAVFEDSTKGSSKSFSENILKSGATTVNLVSSSKHSSIFSNSTLDKFNDKGRALITMTEKKLCGGREDKTNGWEASIEDGYSIIETDYPRELVSYLKNIQSGKTRLSTLIAKASGLNMGTYSNKSQKKLKEEIKSAKQIETKGTTSLKQIETAAYDLQESINSLSVRTPEDDKENKVKTIVVISFLAITFLIIAGYFLFKKNKPKEPKKNKAKQKNLPL